MYYNFSRLVRRNNYTFLIIESLKAGEDTISKTLTLSERRIPTAWKIAKTMSTIKRL